MTGVHETYRERFVDDNAVTENGAQEGACVPVGTGAVAERKPVGQVEECADQQHDMAHPPGELRALFEGYPKLEVDKKKGRMSCSGADDCLS